MTGGKPLLTNFSTCHRIECCAKAERSLSTTLRMLQKHFFHFQEGGNGQCHDFVIYFFQAQSHLSCSTYTHLMDGTPMMPDFQSRAALKK